MMRRDETKKLRCSWCSRHPRSPFQTRLYLLHSWSRAPRTTCASMHISGCAGAIALDEPLDGCVLRRCVCVGSRRKLSTACGRRVTSHWLCANNQKRLEPGSTPASQPSSFRILLHDVVPRCPYLGTGHTGRGSGSPDPLRSLYSSHMLDGTHT